MLVDESKKYEVKLHDILAMMNDISEAEEGMSTYPDDEDCDSEEIASKNYEEGFRDGTRLALEKLGLWKLVPKQFQD
jgi:hypothetical protein